MPSQYDVDTIVKGIEISWTTWGKMRDKQLVLGDISYVKSENGRGFKRIFAINIEENQEFRIQQMISYIKAKLMPDDVFLHPLNASWRNRMNRQISLGLDGVLWVKRRNSQSLDSFIDRCSNTLSRQAGYSAFLRSA